MRLFGFLALFLSFAIPALASPLPGQVVLGASDVLRGRILQEHHFAKAGRTPISTDGHFTVTPAHGLIWSIDQPVPTATVLTRSGMVQSFNGVPIMQVPVAKVSSLIHFYDMLGAAIAGNWQPLESDFTVQRNAAAGNNGAKEWQVVLTPRADAPTSMPYQTITLTGSHFLESAVMLKANGDYEKLSLTGSYVVPTLNAEETAAFASVRP